MKSKPSTSKAIVQIELWNTFQTFKITVVDKPINCPWFAMWEIYL
jgi:hypothetical protein